MKEFKRSSGEKTNNLRKELSGWQWASKSLSTLFMTTKLDLEVDLDPSRRNQVLSPHLWISSAQGGNIPQGESDSTRILFYTTCLTFEPCSSCTLSVPTPLRQPFPKLLVPFNHVARRLIPLPFAAASPGPPTHKEHSRV